MQGLLLYPELTIPANSYHYRVIYCYSLPEDPSYAGAVKVGMTTVSIPASATLDSEIALAAKSAEHRIRENIQEIYGQKYIAENGVPNYLIHWWAVVDMRIQDHNVHAQLKNGGFSNHAFSREARQKEWFNCSPEEAQAALRSIIDGLPSIPDGDIDLANLSLRPEQSCFIENTVQAWHSHETERLWNAKPRFGKTFTALEFLAKARQDYLESPLTTRPLERVLILTHRPVVNAGWAQDFTNLMSQRHASQGWKYASKNKAHLGLNQVEKALVDSSPEDGSPSASPYIYFASVQDARGKDGNTFKASNEQLFGVSWDLIIIDEAHEGNLTELAQEVHEQLTRGFTLYLSGTPFRHLASGTFDGKVDSWDYIDEQRAKAEWDSDEPNPYENLPRMWIYTLDLAEKLRTVVGTDEESGAFSFTELFALETQENGETKKKEDAFKHEEDVKAFLDALCNDESIALRDSDGNTIDMPYSDNGRRESRHALWVLPPRVAIAKRLEEILKEHWYFKDYTIVNVAGNDESGTKSNALTKVEAAIYGNGKKGNPSDTKTITLTVGKLTTGVTVKPWTTCLMLNNMTSAEQYMQTIFRVQSPHEFDGKMKSECFVYDFAPDRALKVIAEANSISSKAGERNSVDATRRLEELTNYMPIMSAVDRTTLQRADASYISTAVKRIYRERVIEAGFDSPLLFIRDLQNISPEIREALDEVKLASGKNAPVTREKVMQDIEIAHNGLGNYKFAENDNDLAKEIKLLEEKPRKERTPEEEAALEAKKAEEARRQNIRNILRTMSVRIPAMCIGLVSEGTRKIKELKEDFTLEKFAEAFDEESWSEFFGTIGKETFLTLAPCFDSEILQVAVAGWIKEIEDVLNIRKEAERLKKSNGVEPFQEKMREFQDGVKHITSRIKNPNKETVFTPYDVVELVYEAAGFTTDQKLIDEMRASYGLKEMVESQPIVNEDPLIVGCLFGKPWTGLRGALVPSPSELGKPIEPGQYSTFYDINVKSGLFPLYAASQLAINNPSLSWDEICNNSIYANSRTLAGKWITAALLGMPKDWENITVIDVYEELNSEDLMDASPKDEEAKQEFVGHFLLAPLAAKQGLNLHISDITKESHRDTAIEIIKARRAEMKDKEQPGLGSDARDKLNQELDLRFDFVVSNPPYQLESDGTAAEVPIYPGFIEIGRLVGLRSIMITPARFLFNAGKTKKSWNEATYSSPEFQVLHFEPNSQAIFPPPTDVKGGVAITSFTKGKTNGGYKDGYIAHADLDSILGKLTYPLGRFSDLVPEGKPYSFVDTSIDPQSQGIRTYALHKFPEVFVEEENKVPEQEYVEILGLDSKNNRIIRFIKKELILQTPNLKDYKVFVPKANGSGAIGEKLSTPVMGYPVMGCTESFLNVGSFKTETEALNMIKYLKTRFLRLVLGSLKVTQDNPKRVWRNIPIQDFTNNSWIEWDKTVDEIDNQLFAHYGLSEEEIAWAQNTIRRMQ